MSAFGRAYHTEHTDQPIFADRKARELMTDEEYSMITAYILGGIDFFAPDKKDTFSTNQDALTYLVNTQIAPTPLVRAAFCEDALKTAVHTTTQQYVILGAGMDTFAFREPEFLRKYDVFEVDHPLTQEDKRAELVGRGGQYSKNSTLSLWISQRTTCVQSFCRQVSALKRKHFSHGSVSVCILSGIRLRICFKTLLICLLTAQVWYLTMLMRGSFGPM